MELLDFLKCILPEEGWHYAVVFDPTKTNKSGTPIPIHKGYETLEQLATAIATFSKNQKISVYHACASYKEAFVLSGEKKQYRIPENQLKAKAFWLDIDCGEDKAAKNAGYATKAQAIEAVTEFCLKTKLEPPLMVDSGNGLHCYWPLVKPIPRDTWVAVATALKALTNHHGLLADNSRTADFASILRPVGSFNRKGDTAKEVRAIGLAREYEAKELARSVLLAAKECGTVPIIKAAPPPSINDDLTAHTPEYIASSAVEVANQCAQVAAMRDSRGNLPYEHWRSVIGVIKHCTEGDELAHEWSLGYPGYDYDETQAKLDTWNYSATTCEHFSSVNPQGCNGCPHKGKIKSPIVLGRVVPESEEQQVPVETDDGKKEIIVVPQLPKEYAYVNNMMVRYIKDKDGVWQPHPFCADLFYPVAWIKNEESTYQFKLRHHMPDGRTHEFVVGWNSVSTAVDMIRALTPNTLHHSTHKGSSEHMHAYLRDAIKQLQASAKELHTMTSFGWKDDMTSFLVGDRLYHKDGTIRRVLLSNNAQSLAEAFPNPKGTVAGYAKALNYVYNRSGMESLQYAICSGFGSALTPLGESLYKGLIMAITGGESGKGKTTACYAALYAWGDADRMGIKSDKGSTLNARYSRMGAFSNIPTLFDELTNIDPGDMSELAYTVSLGQEKDRLKANKGGGVVFAQANVWQMSPFATANKDLMSVIAADQLNSQAEAVRMIQIRIDKYPIPILDESSVGVALNRMAGNMGCAGETFIHHVVQNLPAVQDLFQSTLEGIGKHIPGPKFRFYRNHAACTLTAAQLMVQLGICEFDYEKLYAFSIDLMKSLVEVVGEQNTLTPEDAFYQMINDFGPRILSTSGYRDGRDRLGPEQISRPLQGVVGRYIAGNGADSSSPLAGKLYISRRDATEWCQKNRFDFSNMVNWLRSEGVVVNESERFNLTKGTGLATIRTLCFGVDMTKLDDAAKNLFTVVSTDTVANVANGVQ